MGGGARVLTAARSPWVAAFAALALTGLTAVAAPATAAKGPVVSGLSPDSGPIAGGTSVTITGTGLGGATAVEFGGVASPLFRVEGALGAERIVAFSPAPPARVVAPVPVQVRVGSEISGVDGPTFTYQAGTWYRTADPLDGSPRGDPTATLLEPPACQGPNPPTDYPCGRVLVAGGSGSNVGDVREEIYDPAGRDGRGAWAVTEYMSAAIQHVATLLDDGRVVATGGRQRNGGLVLSDVRVFDPRAVGVVDGIDVPGAWRLVSPMASPRRSHTATLLDRPDCHGDQPPAGYPCGRVLVVGGLDRSGDPQTSVETFDPDGGGAGEGSWMTAPALSVPRAEHTATLLPDGTVLVAGGTDDNGEWLTSAETYDPAAGGGAGRWDPVAAPMRLPRSGHGATLLDRPDCHGPTPPAGYPCVKVLVVGTNPATTDEAEIYDPVSRTWVAAGGSDVLGTGSHLLVRLAGGNVLAMSRQVGAGIPPAAVYDPSDGTWSAAAGLPAGSNPATLILTALGDGRALATNVSVAGGGPAAAYTFDPAPVPAPEVDGVEPAAGSPTGGTRVKVRGSHLFGAPPPGQSGTVTSVRFDTTLAADVDFVSDSELVATSPPHPRGLVAVTVATSGGTSRPAGPSLFSYVDEGRWAPTGALDGCSPPPPDSRSRSCAPRADHRTVLLDPPACRGDGPPPGYPCGAVLAVGRSRATFDDGEVSLGSPILASSSGRFTDHDIGLAVSNVSPPDLLLPSGTTVKDVVDSGTVELSAPFGGPFGPAGTTVTNVQFSLSGNSAERYDPGTGTWQPTGPMVSPGTGEAFDLGVDLTSTVTLLKDGTVLVTGGCCRGAASPLFGSDSLDTTELYDPMTNSWSASAPMPVARAGHSATLLDRPDCHSGPPPSDGYPCGNVLVAGGRSILDGPETSAAMTHLYDPVHRTWSEAGNLGTWRMVHSATLLPNGDVVVVGGINDPGRVLSSTEIYRPSERRWTPAADAPEPKVLHSATLLDRPDCHDAVPPSGYPCGKLLVAGNANGYDELNRMPAQRSGSLTSVDVYDPATNAWAGSSSAGGPEPEQLHVGRAAHSATLLPDGDVLLAGGFSEGDGFRPITSSAEVYEPASGHWRTVMPLTARRAAHSATLLEGRGCATRCGLVLVAGGREAGDAPKHRLASAELYTPAPAITLVTPGSGPSHGGSQVVISGTSLGQATQVRFGGVPATIVSSTGTSVAVATPEHVAGRVEVEVISPAGTSAVRAEAEKRSYGFNVSRPPGPVGTVEAQTMSATAIGLRFAAATSDGPLPPPAGRYVVKVAAAPIVDEPGFAAAIALCEGECEFAPPGVGAPLSMTVGALSPGATYHFAVRAINEVGAGPLSNSASATTTGGPPPAAKTCDVLPPPRSDQVRYPSGYSLVGLPEGSVVGAGSVLYSWFNQGAEGTYALHDSAKALAGGSGYWMWSPCPRLVNLAAAPAVSPLPIGAYRASMVGNPTSEPVRVSGFDWAARWDPSDNAYHLSAYREAQTLPPGHGIWVFSYTDTTIFFGAA